MRKFLAVLLAVAMLLGACACAEGVRFTLGDIMLYENDEMVADLTGFFVDLAAVSHGAEEAGFRFWCDANDDVLMNFTLGVNGNQIVLGYGAGEDLTGGFYAPMAGQSDSLSKSIAAIDLIGDGSWTLTDTLSSVLPEGCLMDSGSAEYAGEACVATPFELDEDYIDEMLRTFMESAELTPEQQEQLASLGVDSIQELMDLLDLHNRVTGCLYAGEAVDAVEFKLSTDLLGESMDISMDIAHSNVADGHLFDVTIEFKENTTGESISVKASIEAVHDDSAPWLPLDVSRLEELDVANADLEALKEQFKDDMTLLIEIAGAGAMNVMYSNILAASR